MANTGKKPAGTVPPELKTFLIVLAAFCRFQLQAIDVSPKDHNHVKNYTISG
jgi:hypothetical protein